MENPNALRWQEGLGHYEVHYLTLTDRVTGVGAWVRYSTLPYCYNSETASMRLNVFEHAPRVGGWRHIAALVAPGRAHFEYGQRAPIPEIELLTQ